MNCCCDLDCSPEDKKIFTSCTGSSVYNPFSHRNKQHSCVKSYVMYRDNGMDTVDRSNHSLFCVVTENMKQSKVFDKPDVTTLAQRISHGKLDSKPRFTWDTLLPEADHLSMTFEPYRFASIIWTIAKSNSEEDFPKMFRLPAPYHTERCQVQEPIKFLQDSVSSCDLPLPNLERQCGSLKTLDVNHFVKNYSVIGNPLLADQENSTTFLDVTYFKVCYNRLDECDQKNEGRNSSKASVFVVPPPNLNPLTGNCENILSHLNITFIHQGILGITKVVASALLLDLPVKITKITQKFQVDFIWNNSQPVLDETTEGKDDNLNATTVEDLLALRKLPRSGNPGYLVGKPLILGRKVVQKVLVNATSNGEGVTTHIVEKMKVLPDVPAQWLQIQGAGDCPLNPAEIQMSPRNPILFGYEHSVSCKLPLDHFFSCEGLQKHVSSIIFGVSAYQLATFAREPLYIAAYGSPDAFPSDWLRLNFIDTPFLLESPPNFAANNPLTLGCDAIITSVHITIAFAYVGPVDSPQAKISGVFFESEEPITLLPPSEDNPSQPPQDLSVSTTVSFVDVTEQPTTLVATWPVLSIRLPDDFFYPFTASKHSKSASSGGESSSKVTSRKDYVAMSFAFILIYGGTLII